MSHPVREDQLPRSVAEFHAWHARQPERWEYVGGVPRLMAPASMNHGLIKKNITTAFDVALGDGPCVALPDGVQVEAEDLVAQPDAVITCAPVDHATPVVREPIVIVEVLSPSSQADDTIHKLAAYTQLPSLRHYLVVWQDRRRVLHMRRTAESEPWQTTIIGDGAIRLDPPGLELAVARIYRRTSLAAGAG